MIGQFLMLNLERLLWLYVSMFLFGFIIENTLAVNIFFSISHLTEMGVFSVGLASAGSALGAMFWMLGFYFIVNPSNLDAIKHDDQDTFGYYYPIEVTKEFPVMWQYLIVLTATMLVMIVIFIHDPPQFKNHFSQKFFLKLKGG